MTRKVSLGERLRYGFDKSMARGTISLIGWLALITLIFIFAAAAFLAVTGITNDGSDPFEFPEAAWQSMLRTLDTGTMAGDVGWPYRWVALGVTLFGVFIFSALVGILTTGIGNRLTELRKGRSRVLEEGHTVIFNWSPSIFDIISELHIANASVRRPRLVIMANKDKVEMEDEIAAKGRHGKMKIICRSGDPTDLYDISIVSPESSKSIIILSPPSDDPDSQVVKTILALVNDPKREKTRFRIAAEIRNARNAEIARIVGGSEVQLILADELISRVVVHSSRQVGLSAVYSELLDFDGCEIYTTAQDHLAGRTVRDAVRAYDSCSFIGICDAAGNVKLNPAADTIIPPGSRAIIIAEDDAAIRPGRGADGQIADTAIQSPVAVTYEPERTLILGWNRRGRMIANELSRYVERGSKLTIAAEVAYLPDDVKSLTIDTSHLAVEYQVCDTTDQTVLTALDVPSYDHVMVLGYSDDFSPQAADTRTLVTLLHLRRIAEASGKRVSVVSEMIDVRNRELAEVTRADDFVVSNKLVSLMLAQASENEMMAAIFGELLDDAGCEIYMRPVGDLVAIDQPVSFHTIAESALRRGEIAFGYSRRREGETYARNMGGVTVNPDRIEKLLYQPGDRIIVLSES